MLIFRISRTHFFKIKKNLGRKFLEFVWAVFVNIDYLKSSEIGWKEAS